MRSVGAISRLSHLALAGTSTNVAGQFCLHWTHWTAPKQKVSRLLVVVRQSTGMRDMVD